LSYGHDESLINLNFQKVLTCVYILDTL